MLGEFSAARTRLDIDPAQAPVSGLQLGALLKRIADGTISGKIAKEMFDAMWTGEHGAMPTRSSPEGLRQISDADAIEENRGRSHRRECSIVAEYKAGKEKAFDSLIGKAMARPRARRTPRRSTPS